jgi:hypothetical protein
LRKSSSSCCSGVIDSCVIKYWARDFPVLGWLLNRLNHS